MNDLKAVADDFAARLTQLACQHGTARIETKVGPNYIKVTLHGRRNGLGIDSPAAVCFIGRSEAPFGWSNFRAGDILPPKTWASLWKMDTGAVGSLFAPDQGMSYWVIRYGAELGLWPEGTIPDRPMPTTPPVEQQLSSAAPAGRVASATSTSAATRPTGRAVRPAP